MSGGCDYVFSMRFTIHVLSDGASSSVKSITQRRS